jgi:hypothetical protein
MSVFRAGGKKSSESVFPSIRPTLDLDFANSKTLDPRITFTRSSGGSYVGADGLIKLAGVNEPRFDHDPVTGESLGLLIEEARTNLLLRSEEWTQGSFGNGWFSSSGFFENIVTDYHPRRGNIEVTHFGPSIDQSSFNNAITNQTIILGSAGTYVAYADYKAVGRTTTVRFLHVPIDGGTGNVGGVLELFGPGRVRNVNFTAGNTFGEQLDFGSYHLGNGWYRCYVVFTTIRSVGDFRFRGFPYIGTSALVGNGDESGLYGTMAQLEAGAFATSYIPTEGSTRTRAADNASITGKNFTDFYRQDEGTIYSNVKYNARPISGIANRTNWVLRNETIPSGLTWQLWWEATNTGALLNQIGSLFDATIIRSGAIISLGDQVKMASAFKTNNYTFSQAGGTVQTDSSVVLPNHTLLEFGRVAQISSTYLNGTISRLTYYPRRLPDAQLQALTK